MYKVDVFDIKIDNPGIKVEVDELPNCMADETQINQVFSKILDRTIFPRPTRASIINISGEVSDDYEA